MTVETHARKRPSGRRAGDSGTRDEILDAALRLFAAHGYEGTSIRSIAAAAGVDPALIRHFYGDKETLFATAVADRSTIPERILAAVAGDPSVAGRAFTDTYLRLWEQPDTGPILRALVRSATTSQRAADMLRETLSARGKQTPSLGPERIGSVALAGAHLLGVAVARHIVRAEPIAALTHAQLVDQLAPTIQRYLDGTHL